MPRSSTTLADYAASGLKKQKQASQKGETQKGHALQQTSLNDTKRVLQSCPHIKPSRLCGIRSEQPSWPTMQLQGWKSRQNQKGGKPKKGYALQQTSFNDIVNDILEQGAENCLTVGQAAGVAQI